MDYDRFAWVFVVTSRGGPTLLLDQGLQDLPCGFCLNWLTRPLFGGGKLALKCMNDDPSKTNTASRLDRRKVVFLEQDAVIQG